MEAEVLTRSADLENKEYMSAQSDTVSKSNTIKLGLEKNISEASKQKIYAILDEASKLSDVEKLLLYLKLPTGVPQCPGSSGTETGFQRDEHQKALRWLRTHLEEDSGNCLQKQELYEDYRTFCERHKCKSVNQFDFGKLLRQVFPRLKLRHLGQRGQSKTCYGGLKNCDELKPLTIEKLDIVDEGVTKGLTGGLGDDGSVTEAACELVCEWAQKLHENRHFSSIQYLAEHLINSCVVSTHSTAAFTIIAAAQREDRKIVLDNQSPYESSASSNAGQMTGVKSTLQPKTHLQLQRTLKGRKVIREQKEKMEGRSSRPSASAPEGIDLPPSSSPKQERKETSSVKKVIPQKHILPKCSLVTDIPAGAPRQSAVRVQLPSQDSHVVVPTITSSPPVFMLPSTPHTSQVTETTQIIRPHQMVLLSPVKHMSKPPVAFATERVTLPAAQVSVNKSTPTKTSTATTSRPNSTLAMLLTEKLDNTISARSSMSNSSNSSMEPSPKLLRSCSADHDQAVVSPMQLKLGHSNHGNRGSSSSSSSEPCPTTSAVLQVSHTQPSFVISGPTTNANASSGTPPLSVLSFPSQASRVILSSAEPSPTSSTPPEQGSQQSTCNAYKSNKAKKKLTPLKPRPSSKTVSTLLKETRGYGPLTDMKGFVNDRRPVAQLLKECRKRRTSGEDSNNQASIVIAPPASGAPGTCNLAPTPFVTDGKSGSEQTIGLASETQLLLANRRRVMSAPDVLPPLEPIGDTVMNDMFNVGTPPSEDSNIKTEILYVTPRGTPQGTPHGTPRGTPVHFSGHPQMPSQKPASVLTEEHVQLSDLISMEQAPSNNDNFQYFGKMISLPDSVNRTAANQDNNNNQEHLTIPVKSSRYRQTNHPDPPHQHTTHTDISAMNPNWRPEEKGEVNVNTIESDAMIEYLGDGMSSDLADITPSLTMDSQVAGDQEDLTDNISLTAAPHGIAQTQLNPIIAADRALVMQNSDPFIGFQGSVNQTADYVHAACVNARTVGEEFPHRPTSELMNHNLDAYNAPSNQSARPSTMPPEINFQYNSHTNLQNYLTRTQPSVCVADQNSTDSFSGYNTPQMTPASQPTLTRSPSLCSAPSTPSSMLSPRDRFTNSEPTNSFMPIQGNTGTLILDPVSPIRPMARSVASSHQLSQKNISAKANAYAALIKNFPAFTNSAVPVNFGGSFVPYNTPDSEPTDHRLAPQQQQQQQQQQHVSFQQDSFLPASSIRPVKRPMAASQPGKQKRVRHRSAQDAKSLSKAQAKNNKYNMLTSLLRAGPNTGLNTGRPSIQDLCEAALQVQTNQATRRPTTLPKPLSFDESLHNMSNPQSPFSPEMQDIMTGESYGIVDSQQDPLATNIFRSHSVPAQSLQRAPSETSDFAPQQILEQADAARGQIAMVMVPPPELQQGEPSGKMGATQNVEFGARRNLNNLLHDEATSIQQLYRASTVRGDHMISGASVRNSQQQQQQMTVLAHQILAAQKAQRSMSYHGQVVPTPPSSQTPTPDFSAELSTLGDNGNTFSMGRVASSVIIDTPNSLDTLTPHDSRESLLVGMCEESDVIAIQPSLRQPQTQWASQPCQWGPS